MREAQNESLLLLQAFMGVMAVMVLTIAAEISERKRAEVALRESEERFRQITENIREVFWIGNVDFNQVFYISPGYEEIWGRTCESLYASPRSWMDAIHPKDRYRLREVQPQVVLRTYEHEFRIIRPDGTIRWIRNRSSPIRDGSGKVYRIAGIAKDITERKQTEEMLRDYARRLQNLSDRLVEAQEAERRRISRELHDEIGQALTVVKIQLQALQRWPTVSATKLEECVRIVDHAVSQVRNLSLDLHPPQLDDLGLLAALRWHLDRHAHVAKLTPHFVADELPSRLHSDLENACFRIAQETLTNVIRHAHAHRVWVELRRRNNELHLIIRDDGQGFDLSAARDQTLQGTSMGLLGMQERAAMVGGRLELNSIPQGGTIVHAVFPLTYTAPRSRLRRRKP